MNRVWLSWIAGILHVLLQVGCGMPNESTPQSEWQGVDSTYAFDEPDEMFNLNVEIEEISGLTFMEDGLLGVVQDEKGILYILDPVSGDVVDRRTFAQDGDYEGIERGGGLLFIIRSDGKLFVFENWEGEELQGDSYDLDLVKGCDAEGIAYQSNMERLLISCKERAGKGLDRKKTIFAFDPATQELAEDPVYVLDVEAFEASVEDHPINEAIRSVMSDRLDLSGFKPSGLAIHPRSGDIFIISSVTKVVIRMQESGQVTAVWPLPSRRFDQPEGIAFGPDGDLFISNEAGDRKYATLLRFRDRSANATAQPTPSNE